MQPPTPQSAAPPGEAVPAFGKTGRWKPAVEQARAPLPGGLDIRARHPVDQKSIRLQQQGFHAPSRISAGKDQLIAGRADCKVITSSRPLETWLNIVAHGPTHHAIAYWGQGNKVDRDSRFSPAGFINNIFAAFGPVGLERCAQLLSPVIVGRQFILSEGDEDLRGDRWGRVAFANPSYPSLLVWLSQPHNQWLVGSAGRSNHCTFLEKRQIKRPLLAGSGRSA